MPVYYAQTDYISHYGVKGQRWGVRQWQNLDGSLTAAGWGHYGYKGFRQNGQNGIYRSGGTNGSVNGVSTSQVRSAANNISRSTSNKLSSLSRMAQSGYSSLTSSASKAKTGVTRAGDKVSNLINTARYKVTGKQYVDSYLDAGTTLKRIQSYADFEDHAFYATYKKDDVDKYLGLFGKNLTTRANAAAKQAEKLAKKTGSEEDIQAAKDARAQGDNMKIYQLSIKATKKLKVASDDHAADITAKLLKDSEFKKNLEASLEDSKSKMLRPGQQLLFSQAKKALSNDVDKLTSSEKKLIYKAFNLSLTNHNDYEIAAQNKFYGALKKAGYGALLDYNDKEYSSYHAKRPMIIFDMDSVKLSSVSNANEKVVNKLYTKYNNERIVKEIGEQTIGTVSKFLSKSVSECTDYVNKQLDNYLETGNNSGKITGRKTRSQIKTLNNRAIEQYKSEHPNTQLSDKEILAALNRSY